MTFAALRTISFRNLADQEIDTQGKDVFLVGENGQGKSNFLEALYFCSYASSFRGAKDSELVRINSDFSPIEQSAISPIRLIPHEQSTFSSKDCSVSAKLADPLYDRITVKLENNKKSITIDGKPIDDRKELLSVIPCIVFCHEDMEFVAGTPEMRRWFFDQTQSLYDPVYLDDLRKYRKILKTKNTVLKTNGYAADNTVLDTLDDQLAGCGLRLMEKREEAVQHFSGIFGPLYEEVSGIDSIAVRYTPSWKAHTVDGIGTYLGERREQEKAMGVSLSGPHRDRYIFMRGDSEFTGRASTGQRRLLALLLRIAQARRFSLMTGKNPVLLLDDVLLELDPEKRRKFLAVMPEYDQAFYTFLPEEPYDRYRKGDTLVYHVVDGCLTSGEPRTPGSPRQSNSVEVT
ncbi:DNA replication and repair protein RecF [Spirochaetia bacterium]|nr:DNA replication and repair protein RecF [Spirochaetia bacterium]